MCRERGLVSVVQSKRRETKMSTLLLIERCCNTMRISVRCIQGCLATDRPILIPFFFFYHLRKRIITIFLNNIDIGKYRLSITTETLISDISINQNFHTSAPLELICPSNPHQAPASGLGKWVDEEVLQSTILFEAGCRSTGKHIYSQ